VRIKIVSPDGDFISSAKSSPSPFSTIPEISTVSPAENDSWFVSIVIS